MTSTFSPDFAQARRRFRDACTDAGVTAATHLHPTRGPLGEELACDSAWLGRPDTAAVLVLISATHGVEGFCGSAIQSAWLQSGASASLSADTAVLLIHAINPFGFAWLRRVNEDGVDLNRNFLDFTRGLPENPGYVELAADLLPASLDPETIARADANLAAYAQRHGERAYEEAVSGGQYTHPTGLFYGGTAPSWSRTTVEGLIARHDLARRRRVAVIDFHTGLGPYGYGEVICDHAPGSVGARLAHAWYGAAVTEPALGTSTSVAKAGLSDYGWQDALGDRVAFVALEFGTFEVADMFRVLRADHWLHRDGLPDWTAEETRRIKSAIRKHFYPDADDWNGIVVATGLRTIAQALDGLAAED
ncbi:MAG: M14 family metallopeptidase [Rhodospirillaceae bacterium]|jgi:hypothetical protein